VAEEKRPAVSEGAQKRENEDDHRGDIIHAKLRFSFMDI
jgi:hypothetical protein